MCNYPFSKLTKVAEIILSLTQTPSAIERIFSLQGRIHGRDRNRLNNDTTNMLLMVTHIDQYDEASWGFKVVGSSSLF